MAPNPAAVKFLRGLDGFNRGHFFEAHEIWEEIWLAAAHAEKAFLQGLIQVAAAYHHFSRGNRKGARSLLEAGLKKLEKFPEGHGGIGLEELRAAVRRWIAGFDTGRDLGQSDLPKIVFTRPRRPRKRSPARP